MSSGTLNRRRIRTNNIQIQRETNIEILMPRAIAFSLTHARNNVCHSRAGGNPVPPCDASLKNSELEIFIDMGVPLDPRLRGDDGKRDCHVLVPLTTISSPSVKLSDLCDSVVKTEVVEGKGLSSADSLESGYDHHVPHSCRHPS